MQHNGFPFYATEAVTMFSREQARNNESVLFQSSATTGPTTLPRGKWTVSKQVAKVIEAGKKIHCTGVQVTCDRPATVGLRVYKYGQLMAFANGFKEHFITLGEKQTTHTFLLNETLYEGAVVTVSALPVQGVDVLDAEPYLTMDLIGQTHSIFEIENPDYRIVVVADSKALYSMDNGEYGQQYYAYQYAQYLLDNGKRVSVVDRTLPSATAAQMGTLVDKGVFNSLKFDLLIVALGTNDSVNAATTENLAAYKANQSKWVKLRNRYNKDSSILFVTPGITDRTDRLPNIGGYRDTVATLVLENQNNKCYLSKEHEAFPVPTAAGDVRFKKSETLGSYLHYNGPGQDLVFTNTFFPAVKKTDFHQNVCQLDKQ